MIVQRFFRDDNVPFPCELYSGPLQMLAEPESWSIPERKNLAYGFHYVLFLTCHIYYK